MAFGRNIAKPNPFDDLGQGFDDTDAFGEVGNNNNPSSVLTNNNATVITGKSEDRASVQIDSDSADSGQGTYNQGKNLKNIITNPLEKYSSSSYLWTFACLTSEQFNDPSQYRDNDTLNNIAFSSAGRYDKERVTLSNKKAPEYFVDNFKLTAVIAPGMQNGNSNAVKFEFEIYEPYSMGLFLQSIQVAAKEANYKNYLTAPFVLRLDILGYDDRQQILKNVVEPKYFVIKMTKVTFNVDESGSKYHVEAVPFNHYAFSDETTVIFNDIKLTGSTVDEVLRSGSKDESFSHENLVTILNRIEESLKNAGKISVPDVYDIQFLETAFSTENDDNSEIGKADFGFDQSTGGTFTFLKEEDEIDPETGVFQFDDVEINPEMRSFTFAQGQTIPSIINTIIVSSLYGFEAQQEEKKEDGLVKHFMIDVQVELTELDPITGEFARKITYRIVPYYVHESIDANINVAPAGYNELEKKVTKKYNYIYSGQNADVIKFDIQINNLFYVGFRPTWEARNRTAEDPDSSGIAAYEKTDKTESGAKENESASDKTQVTNLGRPRNFSDPTRLSQHHLGGKRDTSVKQQVAENFHRAFLESSGGDLVRVELEIKGDPYWLIDHGYSNYMSNAEDPKSTITEDNTMNYTSGSVYIYISFKTPTDVNEVTGLYDFSSEMTESPFSGIYRVVMCHNSFENGNFTQRLECVRMVGQTTEYDDEPAVTNQPKGSVVVTDDEQLENRETIYEVIEESN